MRDRTFVAVAAVALVVASIASIGCGPSARGPDSAANVNAKSATDPEGAALVAACTPTGPELCFNAIDDNCNGVVDEGCGAGTGLLQFTIAWGDSPADVDLSVTDPSFAIVSAANKTSPSGLRMDRACAGGVECNGQGLENIYFEGSEPLRGRYVAEVKLVKANGAAPPIAVRFAARIGSRVFGADVELAPGDEKTTKKTFTFEL